MFEVDIRNEEVLNKSLTMLVIDTEFRDVYMVQFSNELIISGYLECAKNDRIACDLLFKNRQFPLAVYHLQQYVEKLSKAFALEFEKCPLGEVVNSHDILEILEKGQRRLGILKRGEVFLLKKWADGIDTTSMISETEIERVLSDLYISFEVSLPGQIENISKEQLIETARYYATITTLSVFTRQHVISTRYPAVYHDTTDFSSYTTNSGFIRSYPLLFAHATTIEKFLLDRTASNR